MIKAVLQNWSVRSPAYMAPEIAVIQIRADHPDGRGYWVTNRVIDADGRLVTTASDSVYKLGRICPKYRKWLKKQNIAYNPKQPIKVKK